MEETPAQYVDPEVSRAKFDREVADFRANAEEYRRRGWLLIEAEFPTVVVVMAAPQLTPPAIVTGVELDYTNYDAAPPSVRLVDPFTREPYPPDKLPTILKRGVRPNGLPPGLQLPPGAQIMGEQPLMQWYNGEGSVPFVCVAGVREYHEHPAHSGDAWELHRADGAGRLVRLLEIIDKYGVKPINQYAVQLVPQVMGFQQEQPPE
jgi:Predicted metal binding domain